MATTDRCKDGGPTKKNGNCTVPGPDGHAVQCVGFWAKDKHTYLERYIAATRGARAKFLKPSRERPAGGAAFIDLFAGPGRSRVRESGEIIRGSPLIALDEDEAPFTRVILGENNTENIRALSERVLPYKERALVVPGDCNQTIDDMVKAVPAYGLNFALIDPYGVSALSFETIRKLAKIGRMDLLIHFPTGDIKRNLQQDPGRTARFITRFLGTESWRDVVKTPEDVIHLVSVLRTQLGAFDYAQDEVRSLAITQSTNVPIYHLVYATKNPLGNKIWQSVARNTAGGQRGFGFD